MNNLTCMNGTLSRTGQPTQTDEANRTFASKIGTSILATSLMAFAAMVSPTAVLAQGEAESVSAGDIVSPQAVVAAALKDNLSLQAKRLDITINESQLVVSKGAFTPVFSASARYDSSNRALNQREFLGVGQAARIFDEETATYQAGIGGRLSLGTQYEISTSATYIDNTYNRRASSLYGPEHQSVAALTVTQPLARGFGANANLAEVRLQYSAINTATYETRATLNQMVGQVLNAIFESEFAQENIRVKKDSQVLANTLLKENQRRVDEGMMSPIDVSQAQVRVAETGEEVLGAETFYSTRLNTLRELTGGTMPFGEKEFSVSDAEGLLSIPLLNRDTLANEMLENSPIYQAALEAAEAEDVRVKYAKNLAYPQVDLKLSLGYNGLGGNFENAYDDFGNRDDPDWGFGLVFSIPLERKADKARAAVAEQRKMQALYEIKSTEIQLMTALDNAIDSVQSAQDRRALIDDAVRFAEEAFSAEQRRLESGMTTSYNVLNQQRELSFVRTRALAAEVDIQKAVTQLYLVLGVLPEELGFNVTIEGEGS
ncbi:TolC family protein [Pelagicoccus sp. SDUM812002]|uniref:TolC family protein n=1 Tax=Pelagicoccus sp. SDUM812002 TaxID=3041266 RepID=UPI00280E4A8B|nr:TolC family protein [Pelagicoccus sp. SDUM812002]MDQ8186502.1 TolC family protein [Pelagicoccus sp. SDUM812002]